MDRLVEICRDRVAAAGGSLDVFGAAEGQTLQMTAGEGATASHGGVDDLPGRVVPAEVPWEL